MVVGTYHLSPQEQARRFCLGLCFYYGVKEHGVRKCLLLKGLVMTTAPLVLTLNPDILTQFKLQITIVDRSIYHNVFALLDSGLARILVSRALVMACRLKLERLPAAIPVRALDGHLIAGSAVNWRTQSIRVRVDLDHEEELVFYVLEHSAPLVVLGLPWFWLHNPVIDWRGLWIVRWGCDCKPQGHLMGLGTTTIESPEAHRTLQIPPPYQDLTEVYSSSRAAHLPPHWSWDCAIDLLPGTNLLALVSILCQRKRRER